MPEDISRVNTSSKKFLKGDTLLWGIIFILSFISVLVIYSSTAGMSYQHQNGNVLFYMRSQVLFLFGGLFLAWCVSKLNPSWIIRHARLWMWFTIIISLLVFVPFIGVEHNMARRWICLPFTSIELCPFDFLRVAVVIDLAYELTIRHNYIDKIAIFPDLLSWDPDSRKRNRLIYRNVTRYLLLPSVVAVVIVFAENLSTAVIIAITVLVMLIVGNVSKKQLNRCITYGFVVSAFAIGVMVALGIGRGRVWRDRVINKLTPSVKIENVGNVSEAEKQRIREDKDNKYQDEQAKIAMASGGLFGKGPGNSTQRSILPHAYDDFVFAFIIEEYGLIFGGLPVIACFIWLLIRGCQVANRSRYYSYRLVCFGLIFHIVLTAFIHMAVSTGSTLNTGQTLPLISRGGSSILANCIALGVVLGISKHRRKKAVEKADIVIDDYTGGNDTPYVVTDDETTDNVTIDTEHSAYDDSVIHMDDTSDSYGGMV